MTGNSYKVIIGIFICVFFFAGVSTLAYTSEENEIIREYREKNPHADYITDDMILEFTTEYPNWNEVENPMTVEKSFPEVVQDSFDVLFESAKPYSPPKLDGSGDEPVEGVWGVVSNAVNFIFGFIGIAAVGMIVYGAFMWMMSGGDPQKTKLAQGTLTWAVVGLIFFIILRLVLNYVFSVLGIGIPLLPVT